MSGGSLGGFVFSGEAKACTSCRQSLIDAKRSGSELSPSQLHDVWVDNALVRFLLSGSAVSGKLAHVRAASLER